ncbi:Vps53-like protein [Dipodascopsis tothii]|uniref:Vps53-like protein n=1 Tax=Dipodascopsis tothii TaxID=44089 RepID=UPI0034CD8A87
MSEEIDAVGALQAAFADRRVTSPQEVVAVRQMLDAYVVSVERSLAGLVQSQASAQPSIERVAQAQTELSSLFEQLTLVQSRASAAEDTITKMTGQIRLLDDTKRNLTQSMTMVKRMQMLAGAREQLALLGRMREYGEAAQLLGAIGELMEHFKAYRSVQQVVELSRQVAELQRTLGEQVLEDFEVALSGRPDAPAPATLRAGCGVMDALGGQYRGRLVTWYCNRALREYKGIFRGSEEAGLLDNVSRRYAYLKRLLRTDGGQMAELFPADWRVAEQVCRAFCETTRDDYRQLLAAQAGGSAPALDVDLLLGALEETLEFEQYLERTFGGDDDHAVFGRAVSAAFEPYLGLWVDSQDKKLSALVAQYSNQAVQAQGLGALAASDEDDETVLGSSTELFLFYRRTLARATKIAQGTDALAGLARTFARWLGEYAERVLRPALQAGDEPPDEAATRRVCLAVNTAEYCRVTAGQLAERLRASGAGEDVTLAREQLTFARVRDTGLETLVRRVVDTDAKHAWRDMLNRSWGRLEAVGDQSAYVTELATVLERVVGGDMRRHLSARDGSAASYDALTRQVAARVAGTYLRNVAKCRPVTEVGAEQMLLDCYVLKKALLALDADPQTGPAADGSYAAAVATEMGRVEAVLKAVLTSTEPPEDLKQFMPASGFRVPRWPAARPGN